MVWRVRWCTNGLSQLITLSVPVLFALYPVAIALVVLTFVRSRLKNPALDISSSLQFRYFCFDGCGKSGGLDVSTFNTLPLFDIGILLIPTGIAMLLAIFVGSTPRQIITD